MISLVTAIVLSVEVIFLVSVDRLDSEPDLRTGAVGMELLDDSVVVGMDENICDGTIDPYDDVVMKDVITDLKSRKQHLAGH